MKLTAKFPPIGREDESIIMFDEPIPIELVYTSDPYTSLKSGDTGKATGWNYAINHWQIMVDWDNNSRLAMIYGVDKWIEISTKS